MFGASERAITAWSHVLTMPPNVFVIPTLGDNRSLTAPEMPCGLPVLCSGYNGRWPELVYSGVSVWVFDPLDGKDVTKKMMLCIDQKDALPKSGKQCRENVEQFTPDGAAKSILTACEMALT